MFGLSSGKSNASSLYLHDIYALLTERDHEVTDAWMLRKKKTTTTTTTKNTGKGAGGANQNIGVASSFSFPLAVILY